MRAKADINLGVSAGIAAMSYRKTFVSGGDEVQPRGTLWTVVLVAIPLFGILAAAIWYAASAWFSLSGPPMPAIGYVALTLGVVFSLVIGCGLMALLFYSSRHGYDEAHRPEDSDSPSPQTEDGR